MLFSCKISSTVLSYLESQNEDLSVLLSSISLPEEFLRDPSYWMKASEMEVFLQNAQRTSQDDGPFFEKVGHAVPGLRSWGVLDSVLRMMPRPQEILAQPQRFLPYFISPEPPLENIVKSESGIAFDLPISSENYPLTTAYLKAAFESLPVYVGQPQAQCVWNDIHVKVNWKSEQATIFENDPGHQISPELLRSVVAQLEAHQKELEQKNCDLQTKNEELEKAMAARITAPGVEISPVSEAEAILRDPVHHLEFIDENSIEILKNNFSRLSDYMVRAQQLITMLIAQDRLSPAVKQAMKKTDWDRVRLLFPKAVNESREILAKTKQKYQEQPYV